MAVNSSTACVSGRGRDCRTAVRPILRAAGIRPAGGILRQRGHAVIEHSCQRRASPNRASRSYSSTGVSSQNSCRQTSHLCRGPSLRRSARSRRVAKRFDSRAMWRSMQRAPRRALRHPPTLPQSASPLFARRARLQAFVDLPPSPPRQVDPAASGRVETECCGHGWAGCRADAEGPAARWGTPRDARRTRARAAAVAQSPPQLQLLRLRATTRAPSGVELSDAVGGRVLRRSPDGRRANRAASASRSA